MPHTASGSPFDTSTRAVPPGLAFVPLRWGVTLGISICLWTLVVHVLGFYTDRVRYAIIWDTAATLLPVICIGTALWELHARSLPRRLRFRTAVGAGAVVGAVSLPFVIPFLWFYHHVVNPHWIDFLAENERRILVQQHATPAHVAERLQSLYAGATDRAQIIGALIGTVVLSIGLALVFYLIIYLMDRRRRHRFASAGGGGLHA